LVCDLLKSNNDLDDFMKVRVTLLQRLKEFGSEVLLKDLNFDNKVIIQAENVL